MLRYLGVAVTLVLLAGCGGLGRSAVQTDTRAGGQSGPSGATAASPPPAAAPAEPSPPTAPAFTPPAETRLTAVHFLDAQHGWLAGLRLGCSGQSGSASECRGLIFHTDDGGRHWTQQYEGEVAPLSLHFISPEIGWAAGGAAATGVAVNLDGAHPGLLLHTTDGGRRWQPAYSQARGALLSVQFLSPQQG